ncbi:AAA family ATPase [Kitasatospora sp. NPDC058406]|uniref:helix-turn-helix transcriptional regulator n=1 Tax=Kitasatospora sp. NPDC058406 TaxID=3346483 RepID=UPI00364D2ACD
MVGRGREQALLAAFVTEPGPGALLLRGETGVGKSALLDHAAAHAADAGHLVLRAAGAEAESELPFAGLHQFLHPLLPRAAGLEAGHRAVFDVVLGRGDGAPPSVMSLGIAVLDLLSLAGSERPVLLVLDDGQWVDAASTDVLGFVARRLTAGPVRLLVGVRSEVASGFDAAALAELPVAALPDGDAERLLDRRHPGLDPGVRRLVLDQACGNPLALLELPPYVGAAHRSGGGPGGGGSAAGGPATGPHPAGLPRRLQHVFGTRIERLDDAVREELLRAALDGAGTRSGGRAARYRMRDVDEAAACGLLDVDPVSGDFVFRHPLVRSTVVQLATPGRRRAAHRELARVHGDDVERRATHLAAAAQGPDEQVAAALETAAESATRRGGALAAVAWLTRAAELSEDRDGRARRLGDAAFVAGHSALLDQARRLTDGAASSDGAASAAATVTSAYTALYEDGDVRSARLQVVAAIGRIRAAGRGWAEPASATETPGGRPAGHPPEPGQPAEVLTRLVNLLLAVNQYAADPAAWEAAHRLLTSMGPLVAPVSLIYRDAWSDVVRHGAGVHERVERAFADLPRLEPWDVTRLAVAAYHVDTLHHYGPLLRRTVDREVETGAVANGMTMLHLVMLDQLAAGAWDEAERTGHRVLELTTAHGFALFAHHGRAYLALLAALRGQSRRAAELQAAVGHWARPRGVGFLLQIADAVGAAAALSDGDYESAYRYAAGITAPGTFAPCAHQASRTLLDLVEAALHTGRAEQARRHALAARDTGLPAVSPRLALVTHGVLSMTAPDDAEAEREFALADAHPAGAHFPFELARIRLAHGVRLRRTGGPRAARHPLTLAAESFERLGAAGWAGRARAELRASGVPAPEPGPGPGAARLATLTWQERRIGELAAGGLTNKEIGAVVRLSPRTVGSHLYRLFPKLGITSRAALRDALAEGTGRDGP